MAKVLSGILTAGDGTALANQSIKIIAINSTPPGVIKGAEFEFTTDGTGAYSFDAETGYYRVTSLSADGGDIAIGSIRVQGLDPTDLPTLLALSEEPGRPVDDALQALADSAAQSASAAETAEANSANNAQTATDEADRAESAASSFTNIRASRLDNPLTHLFKKNKLVDTLSGALTWTRNSGKTYVDRYGQVKYSPSNSATNLLTYSEDFSSAAWSALGGATVTGNSSIAPDGTLTAGLIDSNGNDFSRVAQSAPLGAGQYTYSLFLKAGSSSKPVLRVFGTNINGDGGTGSAYTVDLESGALLFLTGSSADLTSLTEIGSGWFRASITVTCDTLTDAMVYSVWQGVGTVSVWGAQLEESRTANAYIKTEAASASGTSQFGIDQSVEESEGWLIEGASTNIALWSEDFTRWDSGGASGTVDFGYLAPDGSNNASRVTSVGSNSVLVGEIQTVGVGETYTLSIWARQVSGTGRIRGRVGANSTLDFNKEVSGEWQRLEVTGAATTDTIGRFYVIATNDGDVFELWGGQAEQLPFASSYIPTTSSAVTRAADIVTCSFDNNINGYGDAKSVSLKADFFGLNVGNMSLIDTDGAVDFRYQITNSGGSSFRHGGNSLIPGVNPNQKYDFTGSYDGGTELNNYIDGISAGTNNSGLPLGSGIGTLVRLGNTTTGGSLTAYFGHLQDLRIYDFALNADEVAWLAGE